MTRALARLLAVWAALTLAAALATFRAFALHIDEGHPRAVVASVWSAGELAERVVLPRPDERAPALVRALAAHPGATLVFEADVGEGPVLGWPQAALALSFVPGRDGVVGAVDGRTAYVTPDDLLKRQAYDRGIDFPGLQLSIGVDVPTAIGVLCERLGVTASDLRNRGTLRRARFVRSIPGAPSRRPIRPATMRDGDVRAAALDAARYLARSVDDDGRFRYLVDAPTNRTLPGYDWPRHAGATYFLAQASRVFSDGDVRYAALRAASYLRDHATLRCGAHECIGDGPVVDVGSVALTVIAYVEIVRADLDPGYAQLVPDLTAFLRAQQRGDGEFMHLYDRDAGRAVDVQLLFYSGEAALALSRAHELLGDARDLAAAVRAVRHLTRDAWTFFGGRYYRSEEHWTCQAIDDLWDRAPDRAALDFCLSWHDYGRKLQYRDGETPFDCDGAYGLGPFVTPRLTPVGSRTEAVIAAIDAGRRAGISAAQLGLLEDQARRSLALLLRQELRPGEAHLFVDPAAVAGAMPGTEVDWQLRIDYAQHAGSAMLRWLDLRRAER